MLPVWIKRSYADAIATTCTALGVFVGTLIGVSQANMKPELDADEEAVVDLVAEENKKKQTERGTTVDSSLLLPSLLQC